MTCVVYLFIKLKLLFLMMNCNQLIDANFQLYSQNIKFKNIITYFTWKKDNSTMVFEILTFNQVFQKYNFFINKRWSSNYIRVIYLYLGQNRCKLVCFINNVFNLCPMNSFSNFCHCCTCTLKSNMNIEELNHFSRNLH